MPARTYNQIIKALRDAADSHGIPEIAAQFDMKAASLGNALNPWADRNLVKLGLEQAIEIMRISHDVTAMSLIADVLGLVVHEPDDEVPDKASTAEEVMDDTTTYGQLTEMLRSGAPVTAVVRKAEDVVIEIHQTVTRYKMDHMAPYEPHCRRKAGED